MQGDYAKHAQVVEKLGVRAVEVRTSSQLRVIDALIIPGGESTTILKLIDKFDMRENLISFAESHPLMGTCAGLIVMSSEVSKLEEKPLGLLDVAVERNAYGRQRESFIDMVQLSLNGKVHEITGVFIRAPKISRIGNDVSVLATYKQEAVLVAANNILAATFHPELTFEEDIHRYFIEKFC
ncbi:MAG: pyridoxal 5'-phosphate synthase glutaminase subunit PdxT [Calditrichales bacterium]|nr:MAG: pyridoxal 5'-phosphate synthase glutaminase subunit PdxT [Calditrichales bacterium]